MKVYVYDPSRKVARTWLGADQSQPRCVDCKTGLGETANWNRKRCNQCRRKRWAARKRQERVSCGMSQGK